MDINILAGCFVTIMIRRGGRKKKAHSVEKMQWNEKRENKERERGLACAAGGFRVVNRGWRVEVVDWRGIHQINTSVALIVISLFLSHSPP